MFIINIISNWLIIKQVHILLDCYKGQSQAEKEIKRIQGYRMAAKPVVFVIGASGKIGSATISALAGKYAETVEIRAGTRDPDKAPDSIKVPGVTIVQATMGEKEQLLETFKGVDALFIVTPGTSANRAPFTIETAEAAKEAGVKFIMVVSTPYVVYPNTHDMKQFKEIEDKIPQLEVPYCILRLTPFYDNFWVYKENITSDSIFYGSVYSNENAAVLDTTDAGKAAASILADYSKHNGKTYQLASDRYTNKKLAAAFTEELGKNVEYSRIPTKSLKQTVHSKDWQIIGALEFVKIYNDGAPEATEVDLSVLKTLTGEDSTMMKEWVTKNAPDFK
uniref:NmrA-like family domain-containing protein 1 n=1 Tax=Amphimedon queenslandica TaxID=400682 RepID=A0A1X7U366_AMPQE